MTFFKPYDNFSVATFFDCEDYFLGVVITYSRENIDTGEYRAYLGGGGYRGVTLWVPGLPRARGPGPQGAPKGPLGPGTLRIGYDFRAPKARGCARPSIYADAAKPLVKQ